MMHFKRVIDILSSQPKPDISRANAHDVILAALTVEDVTDFGESVETILSAYTLGLGGDEYWVPVFEALIVAHYDHAHKIMGVLMDGLQKRRFTAWNRAYPAVIVGTMKAAVWCDEHAKTRNEDFNKSFPGDLATMLISYSDASSNRDVKDSELGTWIIGQFTTAFSSYFRTRYANDSWHRMGTFSSSISHAAVNIGKASERLMDEVTLGLLHLMSRPIAMKTVALAMESAAAEYGKVKAPVSTMF